jgi:hypothetical protein
LTLKNVRAGHLSFLVEKPTTQQEIVILDKHCQANNIVACTNRKCFCLRDSAISCKVAGTQDQRHSVGDAPPCILYGSIQFANVCNDNWRVKLPQFGLKKHHWLAPN